MAKDVASVTLLDHAKRLYSLLGADDILVYLCREARSLTGARVVVGSYVSAGETWAHGVHVTLDDERLPSKPAVVSAAFAIHRRLALRPDAIIATPAEEWEPVFRALRDGCESTGGNDAICALPLLNGRKRLVGQVVLLGDRPEQFTREALAAVAQLTDLVSVALDGAQRLAFARRDQDRLLLLAEATEEALWDWNLDSNSFWWGGGIQNVIKHWGEVIGTTASWKFGRIHPDDLEGVRASLARASASLDSTWRHEFRFRRGDGTWAVVEDRAYFLRDANGRAYRMIGVLRDITARKWLDTQQQLLVDASAVLAESLEVEKHLETVAALVAATAADWCAIVLFEPDRDEPRSLAVAHRDPARAAAARQALTRALHGAGLLGDLARSAVLPAIDAAHLDAIATRVPGVGALLDDVDAGSVLHVPLPGASRALGAVTLVWSKPSTRSYHPRDLAFAEELARRCAVAIDRARLYEQAQQAIRARDAFMAILGHELRNPLAPITTALHLMKLRDAKSVREQEVIERQVKHLTRLVDDLLDISRIERGKIELSRKPVQLAEVVAKAVEIASPLLEERRHRLTLDVPSSGLMLLADETRIAQVIANLLTNAARYTDPGGNISVSAAREAQNVVLRVQDDGIGMSADLLPRVFDLFVQGPRTPDRRLGGLGLGLSLVRSLVTLHGGTAEAHSDGPGKGCELVVRLPALPVSLVEDDAPRIAQSVKPNGDAVRILVVDDNADAADLLAELLRVRGDEVAVAHDGAQALRAGVAFAPDVVILDIGLPVMDGYEVARRLREILHRRPYLVALTGYGQEHDRLRARSAGFDEHLVKPIEPDHLMKLIDTVARRVRLERAQGPGGA